MINFINPDALIRNAAFSQVAISSGSRTIYTSGQVSIDEHGEIVGAGDLAAQTRQAMINLRMALAAAGGSFADVVKTTTFVVGFQPDQRKVITDAKEPFWEDATPPASAIGVSALPQPEWLIEIEAVGDRVSRAVQLEIDRHGIGFVDQVDVQSWRPTPSRR